MIYVPTAVKRAWRRWFGGGAERVSVFVDESMAPGVAALLADPAYELIPGAAAGQAVAALPPGALVTVTCSPRGKIEATLELAATLANAGHRVIPHLAARLVTGPDMVADIAAELGRHAITEVFVIAGDAAEAAGPYDGALGLLPDLLAAAPQIVSVGVAGYPDGHPLIDDAELRRQLLAKQELLEQAGVAGWVSTQMCFDPGRIRTWASAARTAGLRMPIRLGVPGVVDRARLLRIGARLGVGASLRFASKQGGSIARLVAPGGYDPLHVIGPIAPHAAELGIERLHVFTFNSVAETMAWRRAIVEP